MNADQTAAHHISVLAARPYGDLVRTLLRGTVGDDVTNREVASAEYRRGTADVSLRFRRPVDDAVMAAFRGSAFVDSAEASDVFVNLRLATAALNLYRGWRSPLANQKAAVEHTSLVPCYPINLGTLRSALVGEQVRRALSVLGARTSAHYWVEEHARQLDLVRVEAPQLPAAWEGKADHVIGMRFLTSLNARAKDQPTVRTDLFRQVHRPAQADNYANSHRRVNDRWLLEVLASHRLTLSHCGVRQLEFDFESAVYQSTNWREQLAHAREMTASPIELPSNPAACSETDLQYVERNLVYYGYLLGHHDLVVSVVPFRQRDVVKCAADLAVETLSRGPGALRTLFYGDVLINGRTDSIRDGIFHAVDDFLRPGTWVVEALRQKFLRSRLTSPVAISLHPQPVLPSARSSSRSHPEIDCALLLDELPELLARFVQTGNYTVLAEWSTAAESAASAASRQYAAQRDLRSILGILG